jgi:hypothetical protein
MNVTTPHANTMVRVSIKKDHIFATVQRHGRDEIARQVGTIMQTLTRISRQDPNYYSIFQNMLSYFEVIISCSQRLIHSFKEIVHVRL